MYDTILDALRRNAAGDALLAEVERFAVALALCVTLPVVVGFAVVVTTVGAPLAFAASMIAGMFR